MYDVTKVKRRLLQDIVKDMCNLKSYIPRSMLQNVENSNNAYVLSKMCIERLLNP